MPKGKAAQLGLLVSSIVLPVENAGKPDPPKAHTRRT